MKLLLRYQAMTKLILTLLTLLSLHSSVADANVAEFRKVFHAAVLDQDRIEEFNTFMRSIEPSNAITVAYLAVSEAMLAGVKWNPIEKYEQVKKYESLILKALETDPSNMEIRFLRFCVEFHVPNWLGFENHMKEDKIYILSNLNSVDTMDFDRYFIRYIAQFIRDTGQCNKLEIEQIDKILNSKAIKVVN